MKFSTLLTLLLQYLLELEHSQAPLQHMTQLQRPLIKNISLQGSYLNITLRFNSLKRSLISLLSMDFTWQVRGGSILKKRIFSPAEILLVVKGFVGWRRVLFIMLMYSFSKVAMYQSILSEPFEQIRLVLLQPLSLQCCVLQYPLTVAC